MPTYLLLPNYFKRNLILQLFSIMVLGILYYMYIILSKIV